jgi:chitin disaccharide deacetylase
MNGLVVNADDLGLSREINKGIFQGLGQGVISDASLLMGAPFATEACHQLEEAGIKAIGIHINLDHEFGWDMPAFERYPRPELMSMLDDRAFLARCTASARTQIEGLLSAGLVPSHLDTHHHVHGFFPVFSLLVRLAREYGIPAMRFSPAGYSLTTRKPVPFHAEDYLRMKGLLGREGIFSCAEMVEGVDGLSRVRSFPAELVAHPSSSGDPWRAAELETLLSEAFRREIGERGISIVSFSQLAGNGQAA